MKLERTEAVIREVGWNAETHMRLWSAFAEDLHDWIRQNKCPFLCPPPQETKAPEHVEPIGRTDKATERIEAGDVYRWKGENGPATYTCVARSDDALMSRPDQGYMSPRWLSKADFGAVEIVRKASLWIGAPVRVKGTSHYEIVNGVGYHGGKQEYFTLRPGSIVLDDGTRIEAQIFRRYDLELLAVQETKGG